MVDPAQNYTAHYLEAAPRDQGSIRWCNYCYFNNSGCFAESGVTGTETVIGTGRKNTQLIVNFPAHSSDTTTNNAAKAANITINGKNDWFLPSISELNELYKLYHSKGQDSYANLSINTYLSSSQSSDDIKKAWNQSFFLSRMSENYKYESSYYVRAIRAF
jgi:hypothetical protein